MSEATNPSDDESSQPTDEAADRSPDEACHSSSSKSHQLSVDSCSDDDSAVIGRYRIIRRVGERGFGRVYLAHDDELDRRVAIKVPNPERITHPENVDAYLNEARILARLDHPNYCTRLRRRSHRRRTLLRGVSAY